MPEDIKYILKVYVLQLLIIICFYLVGKGYSKIFLRLFYNIMGYFRDFILPSTMWLKGPDAEDITYLYLWTLT